LADEIRQAVLASKGLLASKRPTEETAAVSGTPAAAEPAATSGAAN
jgi:hypothetical protein